MKKSFGGKFENKFINTLAGLLLALMFFLAFFSLRGDSATMDELAHIPAGYSYIVQKDMRLNPEHPPLLKDLAGLSVWLGGKITKTPINFPFQIEPWQKDINGQWDFGGKFLYENDNNANKIIFWARLPMLLIMLVLGFYVFKWAKELYGPKAGLLALFLYSLSPEFLAHGRLVTTDVGAAAAFFIAAYYFLKCLPHVGVPTSNMRSGLKAGIIFGLALLTKFSLVLLIPYFVFLIMVYSLVVSKNLIKSAAALLLIGLIALALIWPVYQYHTWNYSPDKQTSDTKFILQSFGSRTLTDLAVFMADKPILRPLAQYLLGLFMVMQRAVGGNTTYFLGEVSAAGWPHYFPVVFLIKVPLAFLILILVAFFSVILRRSRRIPRQNSESTGFFTSLRSVKNYIKNHFTEFALLSFIFLYWVFTLKSNLNIGVRHILPTFPFLYVLVSGQIIKIANSQQQTTNNQQQTTNSKKIKLFVVSCLLLAPLGWYAFSSISIYPHFLAYFNELIGGPKNGYQYVVDSNLDWGQDLKRLTDFAEKNKINKIYVDYFGGGSARYYLKEKYEPWSGDRDPKTLPANSWLAISATFLSGGQARPAPGFKSPTDYYNWLKQYQPIAVIGYSIFVYQIQ